MKIVWDSETSGLLNNASIDYNSSPYKLKPSYILHSIVAEEFETGIIHAFYNGKTITLDGTQYCEEWEGYDVSLLEYTPTEYIHHQLDEFPQFVKDNVTCAIAHNCINFDLLVTKLYLGMDYTIEKDSWCNNEIEIVDTMILSKVLNPDRFGGHSLDSIGSKCGHSKVQFRKHIPADKRFLHFGADMLYYNIIDVKVNTQVYKYLTKEQQDWDWSDAISLEKSVADIITRQEHRGFHFDYDLAIKNLAWLDVELARLKDLVEPLLPAKPLAATQLKTYTPTKTQFLKSGVPHAHIIGFVAKHGGELVEKDGKYSCTLYGKEYTLPMPVEPIVTTAPMELKDSTLIKEWLVSEFGWNPQSYKERDLSVNTNKQKLSAEQYAIVVEKYVAQTLASPFKQDRLDHLECSEYGLKAALLKRDLKRPVKVLTNPTFTVGQEKEICPDLERLSKQFPFAKDIVNYLTYKHRRSSILGGDFDYDDAQEGEEPEKGYLASYRDDGRIPTPAGTCDAASARMQHRIVANIPRVTSRFGKEMRGMFSTTKDYVMVGYDFDSLEARIEAHYVYKYEGGVEYGKSLTAQKPNDCHTILSLYISELVGEPFSRGSAKNVKYGCAYNAQAKRIAKTIGKPLRIGQIVFDAYWEKAQPLALFKEAGTRYWETTGKKKFIKAIDGRKIPIRSKGNVVNSAFQSAGVICAKRAMVLHEQKIKDLGLYVDFFRDDWRSKTLFQQLIAVHDEAQGEVSKSETKFKIFNYLDYASVEDAEAAAIAFRGDNPTWSDVGHTDTCFYVGFCKAGVAAVESVKEAGEYYNLNVPLTAGYMMGRNWAMCH